MGYEFITMVIKHIVISGGGPTGLLSYGVIKCLFQEKYLKFEEIETIYGTSIGAILAVIICLKHDWKTIDDYLIKRPWEKVMVDSFEMFQLFSCKGIAQLKMLDDIMKPLLESNDLSLSITMLDFYKYSGITLNIFTLELNEFKKISLSHITHPDMCLMDAIKMSACVPILFPPIIKNNNCYVDGGVICNYPLRECLTETNCSVDEVLGIRNYWSENEGITENSSLISYLHFINMKLIRVVNNSLSDSIPNEVVCKVKPNMNPSEWFSILSDETQRLAWIEDGESFAKTFLLQNRYK